MRLKLIVLIFSACLLPTSILAQEKQRTEPNTCKDRICKDLTKQEEPGDKAEREGRSVVESVRNGNDDKARWSLVKLYSDSTDPAELTMPIVKSAGFNMKLDPNKGRLILTGKHGTDMFDIASAKGEVRGDCFEYTVAISEASAKHALIRLHCSPVEYRPNKFRASVNYYLYDVETSMMRAIWRRTASGKDSPAPFAEPDLSLRIVPNGYKFDWIEKRPGLSIKDRGEAHAMYLRKNIDGKLVLTCTDTSSPKGEGFEDGICLAETPLRIRN
jgi:hypothetical protein